jgi:chromosomal replication initiation ATPase DnaA
MPSIVQPRQKTIAFGRIVLNMSLASLGRTFRRDHTTSIYAIQKYRALVERALGLHRARPENSESPKPRLATTPGSPG